MEKKTYLNVRVTCLYQNNEKDLSDNQCLCGVFGKADGGATVANLAIREFSMASTSQWLRDETAAINAISKPLIQMLLTENLY